MLKSEKRRCSSCKWQSSGISSSHALAIILTRKEDPQTYVKLFFTLEAYRNMYEHAIIHPRYVNSS